jgi:hypothetical protein
LEINGLSKLGAVSESDIKNYNIRGESFTKIAVLPIILGDYRI